MRIGGAGRIQGGWWHVVKGPGMSGTRRACRGPVGHVGDVWGMSGTCGACWGHVGYVGDVWVCRGRVGCVEWGGVHLYVGLGWWLGLWDT